LARPGPWMVWVRYGFGIILFGVALYFLANAGLLPTIPLFAFGFSVALLAWWALARHLVKGEGERVGVARQRGAILAVILILVTGGIAQLTHHEKPPEVASAGDGKGEGWVKLESLDHLKREIARAKELGRPAVVDVWAEWCHNCKLYDAIIESDPYLREKFRNFVRLKIDETDASYDDLRTAVGLPVSGQPRMAFFDEQGRIRKSADIERWFGKDESIAQLKRRIDFLLDE
jgi:thiol:disulfide interchange protein DsbD